MRNFRHKDNDKKTLAREIIEEYAKDYMLEMVQNIREEFRLILNEYHFEF